MSIDWVQKIPFRMSHLHLFRGWLGSDARWSSPECPDPESLSWERPAVGNRGKTWTYLEKVDEHVEQTNIGKTEEPWSTIEELLYFEWSPPWHSIWYSFLHSIWHSFWHSIWHSFRHSIWHLLWHTFWHSIVKFFLAFYLASIQRMQQVQQARRRRRKTKEDEEAE